MLKLNNKSPFGYILDEEKQIDSYGVDHSGFSLRDEIAYQIARTNQEEKLQKCFNNQGVTKSYPQFGNSFWGGNSANNYGFGTSNIEENIEEMKNNLPKADEFVQKNTITKPNNTQQLTMPASSQQYITVAKNPQPHEHEGMWNTIKRVANNFADATEAGAVGFTGGLTLENFDEGKPKIIRESETYEGVPKNIAYRQVSNVAKKKYFGTIKPKNFTNHDIVIAAIAGVGQGLNGGIERVINAASNGKYAKIIPGYEKRQNELARLAEQANLKTAYDLSNKAIDKGTQGYLILKALKNLLK